MGPLLAEADFPGGQLTVVRRGRRYPVQVILELLFPDHLWSRNEIQDCIECLEGRPVMPTSCRALIAALSHSSLHLNGIYPRREA